MARKEEIRKGEFLTAGGGAATISDRRDKIRKGMYLTSTPRPNSKKLQREFPEMSDALALAGRVPSAADLAVHWARQAELEQRLADLKVRIKSVKRK